MASCENIDPARRQPAEGSVVALSAGEVPLPDFVRRDAGGIRVVHDVPGRSAQMQRFVDRVFAADWYFVGLDHDALDAMLCGEESGPGGGAAVRIAAAMWLQGVRSGLGMGAVRAAIDSAQGERRVIAHRIEPQPGTDATLREQTQALHRDDSPAILPSGRIDLGQFKNHFPQLAAGAKLLQKQPRRLGQPGRSARLRALATEAGKS